MTSLRRRWLGAALIMAASLRAYGAADLRLENVRESLTGTHRQYAQYIDGIRVAGSVRVTTAWRGEREQVTYERLATAPAQSSRARAMTAARIDSALAYVNVDGVARLARRVVVAETPIERYVRYFDTETGALLREEPLFFRSRARVFEINPVARLNDPSLRDANDSATAVPDSAYSVVDITTSGPGGELSGPDAQIVDIMAPFTGPRADSLMLDRSQKQFEEVNAYFHVTREQEYLRSLGYVGARALVAYPVAIDAHAGVVDSSYFAENDTPGEGTLFFGDGGTDDAEDSDIVIHEFAHAIHNWISPGGWTGAASTQTRALAEGFGDYLAFSATYATTAATGRDPFCIGDWDARCDGDDPSENCAYPAGADCLRRVDSPKTMRDYVNGDEPGTEYRNSAIWSSALREIFMTLQSDAGAEHGRRLSDTIVLESLFGLPPSPQFATVAQRMLDVDRRLEGGAHVAAICSAMASRGILSVANCDLRPRGERTFLPAADVPLAIPDAGAVTSDLLVTDSRLIQQLAVRVDIVHPSRGDLRISLVAPDGTTVRLKDSSSVDRTADVHATFGIDAPSAESLDRFRGARASGVWHLVVADVFARDAGTLVSWDLVPQFAGDTPTTARPLPGSGAQFIAAVGHVNGANGSEYRSDLYLLNRGSRDAHVTLFFTPSGADGRADFAAVQTTIAADQTVAFHDVVQELFASTGMGTLTIDGDTPAIVAWSNTFSVTKSGALSQEVLPATIDDSVARGEAPLFLGPLDPSRRTNIGIAEIAGSAGTVRVEIGGGAATVPIAPFSHLQFRAVWPGPGFPELARVSVTDGGARVIAYASILEAGGDPMYVAARRAATSLTDAVIPGVIDAAGPLGISWATEAWVVDPSFGRADVPHITLAFYPSGRPDNVSWNFGDLIAGYWSNALRDLFNIRDSAGHIDARIPQGASVATRTYVSKGTGAGVGERIEPVLKTGAAGRSQPADALHIESAPPFRTNFGVTEVDGQTAEVLVTLYSAGGERLASMSRPLMPHEDFSLPLSALYATPVSDARLRFEVIAGDGRIVACASVIDSRSGDPAFVLAR